MNESVRWGFRLTLENASNTFTRFGLEFLPITITWATRAAESGVDIVTLAAMLGHSKLAMVTRYVHPSEQHQAAAMQKIQQRAAAR